MSKSITRLLELAGLIQQIPAPTFYETERAGFIFNRFLEAGLQDVEIDKAGNVFARLRSGPKSSSPVSHPVIVSAHLDTVFPAGTELTTRSDEKMVYGPGIGDNALGLAGLFGLVWLLQENQVALPYDLWLAANVCEEGLGDLLGMKSVVDRFGKDVRAYLVLEGMALGHIYHRGLGVRRYRITVQTEGGHSWMDYGRPSAIHELTQISTQFTRFEIPRTPRTTLNIGVISGGTTVNTIAAQASLELDLRSENPDALEQLAMKVENVCRQARKEGVEVEAKVIGVRPAGEIPASHPLVTLAVSQLRAQGLGSKLAIGSTDANIPLSRGFPAVTLGLTTGGGAHTLREYINIEPLNKGMEALLGVVKGLI